MIECLKGHETGPILPSVPGASPKSTMNPMFRTSALRFSLIAAGLALAIGSVSLSAQDAPKRGRKYKAPPETARIEITVLRDLNGKPIENAAVIFHPMEGERDKGNMELKTNEDGKTVIEVLPIGDTVRLQIIAKGFQTYGEDFKVDKATMALEIKMKRPAEQYSIYKNHPETAGAAKDPKDSKGASPEKGSGANADKPADPGPNDASDDAPKDKPADSTPPPQSQPQPN